MEMTAYRDMNSKGGSPVEMQMARSIDTVSARSHERSHVS